MNQHVQREQFRVNINVHPAGSSLHPRSPQSKPHTCPSRLDSMFWPLLDSNAVERGDYGDDLHSDCIRDTSEAPIPKSTVAMIGRGHVRSAIVPRSRGTSKVADGFPIQASRESCLEPSEWSFAKHFMAGAENHEKQQQQVQYRAQRVIDVAQQSLARW